MAKDRNLPCIYYEHECSCLKGREGTFYSYCQRCNLYRPKKNSRPGRKDLRKEKNEKFMKDRRNWNE